MCGSRGSTCTCTSVCPGFMFQEDCFVRETSWSTSPFHLSRKLYYRRIISRAVSPLLSAVCHSMALLLTPVSLLVEFSFSQETESPRTAEMALASSPGALAPGAEPITWNGCSRKHSKTEDWKLLRFLAIYLPRQLSSYSNTSAETFFHIFNTCMKFHLIVNYFKQHSIVLKVNKIKFL